MLNKHITMTAATASLMLVAGAALCQGYPTESIRIVTAAAGGGTDFVSRLIARAIAGPLGQQVLVDNRPSGVIPGDVVAKARPDGHTLLLAGGILWIGPLLQKTPYDPVRDFSPITQAIRQPNVLVVHSSLPVKTIAQLITLAKARPGDLNYASAGTGSTQHLSAELFNVMARVNMVRIPYKGGGPALSALLAGEVQVMFASAGSVMLHVKSGRLRTLAITSLQSSELSPDLSTIAASGLPGYESVASYGVFAPAKTPEAIINRLHQEIVRAIFLQDVKEKLLGSDVEPVGSSPADFAAMLKADIAKWGKIIQSAGIRAD